MLQWFHLYIILLVCVCVLYVTLSMHISVHNKSPELFTVKLESPSRRRVKHWALEQKLPDRYARRRFDSPCLHDFLFLPLFFPFLFSPSVFLLQFFPFPPPPPLIPFPSPLLKIFSPPQTEICGSLHGKNQSLKIMMVVEGGGGGGGVALVTFNSRRPLPSAGIT